MKVLIVEDYDAMSRAASEIIKDIVVNKKNAVLGLATGSTPIGMYDLLVKDHEQNGTSYAHVSTVNLDEYVGLKPSHEQSYAYFMNLHFFDRIDINKNNTFIPNGVAPDSKAECERYNDLLNTHVPDVQVLGIGSNGHIGFNEPGTSFESVTHVVNLTESTINDNSRLFADKNQVPVQAYSMGISNILRSKKIIIMASGANKANAVAAMVDGDISESCPASVLRNHPDVIAIIDRAAAKRIK